MGLTAYYGDSFTFLCRLYSYLTGNTHLDLHVLLLEYLYFVYVDDISTSQETHV
jgi:hypothetical protein